MPVCPISSCLKKDNQENLPNPVMKVTWNGYDIAVEKLVEKINASGMPFDQIICVARGGMPLGDALSRIYGKPLGVIFASSYRSENGTGQDELFISKNIAMVADSLGKRILLVDDLTDSGVTLRKLKEHLEAQENVVEVKTAVLWHKSHSDFVPDYYAELVAGRTWIEQPFEKYDGYADIKPHVSWVRKLIPCFAG